MEKSTTKACPIINTYNCRFSWSHPPLCQLLWWPHGATEGTPLSQCVGLLAGMWWVTFEEKYSAMLSQGELVCILTYYCLKTQICICNIKCFTQIWQELVKVGHLTTLPLRYNKHYVTNNFLSQCLTVHYRTRELCQPVSEEHCKKAHRQTVASHEWSTVLTCICGYLSLFSFGTVYECETS